MRASLALAAAALALPALAGAREPDFRGAFRVELSAGGGMSDAPFASIGGRGVLRASPVVLSLGAEGAQAPAVHDQAFLRLVVFGVGLARDAGPWETEASLLVGSHQHRFPARHGLGPQDPSDAAVGLRLGAGRWLGGGASRLAPWLGVSMTVAWSGASENRIREVESHGVVALVAVSVGGGVALRSR